MLLSSMPPVCNRAFQIQEEWAKARTSLDTIANFKKKQQQDSLPYYEAYRLEVGNQEELAQVEVARRYPTLCCVQLSV